MVVMDVMHVLGFVGENGTLVVDRGGWEVIPEVVNGKAEWKLYHGKTEQAEG